ncbi:hypothetical protein E1263_11515 [Kribbella antibiotica]|uniref:DUF2613 family protein n=1 Tax=Kribbella antibiotica TaxID=190195 RepID=A0A4R4ZNG9_9ACTN|nr:hypothetical protein [Kribbella antibiotica]TDD60393.1 hypothetical protein E1263_11515 [Kribbella antibiotica]
MKKIIAFALGTAALVAGAIGIQAFATSSPDESKQPPAATQTTPADGTPKPGDTDRPGYTEDHTGKPGETK